MDPISLVWHRVANAEMPMNFRGLSRRPTHPVDDDCVAMDDAQVASMVAAGYVTGTDEYLELYPCCSLAYVHFVWPERALS